MPIIKNPSEYLARFAIWLVLIAASMTGDAVAASAQYPCTVYARTVTLKMPDSVRIPADAIVGTVLTPWVTSSNTVVHVLCEKPFVEASGMAAEVGAGLQNSGLTVIPPSTGQPVIVWNTGIPGIGVAMVGYFHFNNCPSTRGMGMSPAGISATCDGAVTRQHTLMALRVALVKTGSIQSGVITEQLLASAREISRPSSAAPFVTNSPLRITYVLGSTNIVGSTCAVTIPSQSVKLSPGTGLPLANFTGRDTTSAQVPFSLRLNCSGIGNRVGVTFTDVRNRGNTGNRLPLDDSSTASGLGVQILNGGRPVGFGPDDARPGNTNQIVLQEVSGNSNVDLPFTARYIQTADKVMPGTANAIASFTFSYQ
ncbi:fimbrial protein [Herbaspirillum sp. YR522]|uniref:fimbrial protein n=1 Tax=Herbaspirillum sp. YR522 TaxID=1144342 RepID=UPI00026F4A62|nr:fimbrial protein [Herbaspirillum sp. YR522]EJN09419.1 P pilus assembly protein, pilin FimA [Herbaspirillum sp. YR522]